MLLRFDPLRDFDRLTQQMLSDRRLAGAMPMDVYRSGDHYVLHFDLPGIDPNSIELSVEDNTLTVRAVRPARSDEGVEFLVAERPTGDFTRQLVLGNGLDLTKISATFETGVLTVSIPVAETAKPRRIRIEAGGESPTVIGGENREQAAVAG
jgi:HSP20 family protein